jgi:hypothetical protein
MLTGVIPGRANKRMSPDVGREPETDQGPCAGMGEV